ncbi:MAG: alanine racemase [Planctomycetes bacterium]|nr:alanine racemase [Planctomycetota bacterium]
MNSSLVNRNKPDETTVLALCEIASRYGTPAYAFDVRRLRSQVEKLRSALPSEVEILYSLKSNASLGICDVLADCGIGADVASAGELATAVAAEFPADRIFVAGPFKLPETITQLRETPEAIVSIDSLSELQWLSDQRIANSAVLRLRPDFGSCAVVPAGSESRFGFTCDELQRCQEYLPSSNIDVIGFHVFAGSQVLDAEKLNEQLRLALDLSLRAAETLGIEPTYINLGGGFGVPYAPDDEAFDLVRVGDELAKLAERAAPARIVLELGRYLVAEAGWYLTSVVGHQTFQGRPAVIVDGGVHQRADMCGLCLRSNQNAPLVLGGDSSPLTPTDVLGCLSLPDDVMLEASPLPALAAGTALAFGNAGAYGMWSSPALFHGSPLPAEAAFDGSEIYLMRDRKPAASILDDQHHVTQKTVTTPA